MERETARSCSVPARLGLPPLSVIVDELQTRDTDGRVERSARLRWVGGEFRLSIEVPGGFQPPEGDATGFLLAALPLALYRGEDLQVDGAVSAQTLRQTERIQAIYAAWDPAVRRCRVRVATEEPTRDAAEGQGCLFSRGVDSMHSATSVDSGPLSHLVFCDTLEPVQDAQARALEWQLVVEAADLVGLPVLRISTNLRDPGAQLIDYQVMHGAGIAFMAHSLSGGLGRVVVPADLTYSVGGPSGSHPLLDLLFGSECLTLDYHGLELGRTGKVRQLVATHPELPYLKTCFAESTHANCGRCLKCLMTMISLQAAGALKRASLFPDEIDIDSIRKLRMTADGRLRTDRYEPSMPDLDGRVLTRWTLAPVRWIEVATLAERTREVLRRGIDVASALRRASTSEGGPGGVPCGYLLGDGGEGRLALFSSIHPVSGDQLLSTAQDESTQFGYNAPTLLGFLVAEAPASGVLGLSRPPIPWASRFGR